MWKNHDIIKRKDGSYVIIKDVNPYHVPNEGEWADEWADVNTYAIANPGQVKAEEVPVIPEPTLAEASAAKLAEILADANAMSAAIKAKYSQPEIDSWQLQEAEARALLGDVNAASTSAALVMDLAANDGVSPLEFAKRIVANAESAAAAAKSIILQQQAMEKLVKAAQSVEAVQAVSVNYTV